MYVGLKGQTNLIYKKVSDYHFVQLKYWFVTFCNFCEMSEHVFWIEVVISEMPMFCDHKYQTVNF